MPRRKTEADHILGALFDQLAGGTEESDVDPLILECMPAPGNNGIVVQGVIYLVRCTIGGLRGPVVLAVVSPSVMPEIEIAKCVEARLMDDPRFIDSPEGRVDLEITEPHPIYIQGKK